MTASYASHVLAALLATIQPVIQCSLRPLVRYKSPAMAAESPKRFFLFTHARTTSNVLTTMLAKHPELGT